MEAHEPRPSDQSRPGRNRRRTYVAHAAAVLLRALSLPPGGFLVFPPYPPSEAPSRDQKAQPNVGPEPVNHADQTQRRSSTDQEPRAGGGGDHLRLPRRGHPPGVRPDHRLQDSPRAGPPRAGRRPHGRGLRPRHRSSRSLYGHQRPGCHQRGHAAGGRLPRFGADGLHHRSGGAGGDRHRCVPGVRHHRHHPVDHQAQHPGHQGRGHPDGHQGGVPHRHHRPAWAGAGRHPEEHRRCQQPRRLLRFRVPDRGRPARLQPDRDRRREGRR